MNPRTRHFKGRMTQLKQEYREFKLQKKLSKEMAQANGEAEEINKKGGGKETAVGQSVN